MDDLSAALEDEKLDKEGLAKQEQLAVAADFLGYSQDASQWNPQMMGEKGARIKEHAEFLRAYTDESRLDIIIFLLHAQESCFELPSYSVSEIATRFNISMSTVSHHLQELKRVGIVKMERNGKERYYQLDLELLIERVGSWYERLLTKREMLKRGMKGCPADYKVDIIGKPGNDAGL